MTRISRRKKEEVLELLKQFSAVVIHGQRQVGKTTLAREIAGERGGDYLNLYKKEDQAKLRRGLRGRIEETGGGLIILDEIQTRPDLFPEIRTIIDEEKEQGESRVLFMLLGSAYFELGPTLPGRLSYAALDPIDVTEVSTPGEFDKLWLLGGLPEVFLAQDDGRSFSLLQSIVDSLRMHDIAVEGERSVVSSQILDLMVVLAQNQGGPADVSKIVKSLGLEEDAVSSCINRLSELMVIRQLWPHGNSRLRSRAKRPKIYFRDSGLLHQLLGVGSVASLGDRMTGMSWESFAMENIIRQTNRKTTSSFYRERGAEVDLILSSKDYGTWAIEIKKGKSRVRPGFHIAAKKIKPDRSFLVNCHSDVPRRTTSKGVETISLLDMCKEVAKHFGP